MQRNKSVLLSFDIEEFDVPAEYGIDLPFIDQIQMSREGTERILDILAKHDVNATFFTTVVFAQQEPRLIKRIIDGGHEIGSHGWAHSEFEKDHLARAKGELNRMFGVDVKGFRMARMMDVDHQAIKDAGYVYNSSLNPIYLPGRYNNFFKSRTIFLEDGLVHLPASATPLLRLPLFWLSFHHFPMALYKIACRRTIASDGYLNIYFHPWEFVDLSHPKGLPLTITRKSGEIMIRRFDGWIKWLKEQGHVFETLHAFIAKYKF